MIVSFPKMKEDYLNALFASDKSERVIGELSFRIAVWMRWMDAEVSEENANRTLGIKRVILNKIIFFKVK